MGAVSLKRSHLQQRLVQGCLSSQKLAPFGEGGVSHRFKCGAVVDVAVQIEVIVERSAFCPDLAGEHWTEPIYPEPHALMANIYAPFVE